LPVGGVDRCVNSESADVTTQEQCHRESPEHLIVSEVVSVRIRRVTALSLFIRILSVRLVTRAQVVLNGRVGRRTQQAIRRITLIRLCVRLRIWVTTM
jgi:hypothetical protein